MQAQVQIKRQKSPDQMQSLQYLTVKLFAGLQPPNGPWAIISPWDLSFQRKDKPGQMKGTNLARLHH